MDVTTLRQMVLQLLMDVDDLQNQLAWYKRYVFGRKSEKLDPQQQLLFDVLEEQLETIEKRALAENSLESSSDQGEKKKTSRRNGRSPLPNHLPRERVEYHPSPDELVCSECGGHKQAMGKEVTEELDYVPASFVVRQHVRIKYACKQCQEGVVIADLPPRPIEKGRPGTGLLAHILTSKYADHLPLNRLQGIFARHGVDLHRSTMCDWVRDSAALLWPIVAQMKRKLLQSPKIHTDDTPVPVQDGSQGKTRKGFLWAYIDIKNNVVFDYTPTHSRDGPLKFLGDYAGYLQADAYKGYDAFFEQGKATEVGCWAHARRRFFEARETDPTHAHEMMALIGRLYAVEEQAKENGLDAFQLKSVRQRHSKPVLEQIQRRLEMGQKEVLPKSPIGQAIGYARGQWLALNRYLDNGILDIDNNLAERVLRIVAIGRKNWMFAGSDAGAERAAIIYSVIASCKLCQIDPFSYLRDVLSRVSIHPASRINELLPGEWKKLRQETEAADVARMVDMEETS